MKVREIMSSDLFTLNESDSLLDVKELMEWRGFRHVPVVDEYGQFAGLVTERDFLKLAVSKLSGLSKQETDRLYEGIRIREVMGRKVICTSPDTPLSVAARTMLDHKYGCLPVLDQGKLVGIITESDFAKVFAEWKIRVEPISA